MACLKVKKTLNVWIRRPDLFRKMYNPARQFKMIRIRK